MRGDGEHRCKDRLTAKSLLVLASTVILGFEIHGTHDHIYCMTALGAFKLLTPSTKTLHIVSYIKHNRSGMVAVLGPFEALPCYIHTYSIIYRMGHEVA
jgi:hypothetical protein